MRPKENLYEPLLFTPKIMSSIPFSPIESEFASAEEATSYNQWFTTKVQASLKLADDPRTPRFSSDQVMRRIDATIAAKQTSHAARRVA
jgi:hypothetical protein